VGFSISAATLGAREARTLARSAASSAGVTSSIAASRRRFAETAPMATSSSAVVMPMLDRHLICRADRG